MNNAQMTLFDQPVLKAIWSAGTTDAAYREVAKTFGLTREQMNETVDWAPGKKTSFIKRKIRFVQQSLKARGMIEKAEERGHWKLTRKGQASLTTCPAGGMKIAFTTANGIALYGNAKDLAGMYKGEVECIVTSPPYFLTKPREYGQFSNQEQEFVDELVNIIESLLPCLTESGSIFLNMGDSFKAQAHGEMSLVNEMLLIELRKRCSLKLMDKLVWENKQKPSNGHHTTCRKTHLKRTTENVYWLALNPQKVSVSNQRVLQPYSESFKKLIERQERAKAKGLVAKRHDRPSGNSSNPDTHNVDRGGAIASNLLSFTHEPPHSKYSQAVKAAGLPRHPAMMPVELCKFLIEYATEPGQLIADPFSGSFCTGLAAEQTGRLWTGTELCLEYIKGAIQRFKSEGIEPDLAAV